MAGGWAPCFPGRRIQKKDGGLETRVLPIIFPSEYPEPLERHEMRTATISNSMDAEMRPWKQPERARVPGHHEE